MRVELLLQIGIATLIALSATVMGMGERSVAIPLIAIAMTATSVYVTDYKGWLRLNATMANIAAFLAVIISLFQLQFLDRDSWLLTIAHLLTYWQFVLLFQEKSDRHYWLLLTSSVLQVTVAAALNLELWFGLILIVYLFVGLGCLMLLFRLEQTDRATAKGPPAQRGSRFLSFLAALWSYALRGTLVYGSPPPGHFQPGMQADGGLNRVYAGFAKRLCGMFAVCLVITTVVFLLLPRGGYAHWDRIRGFPQRVSGFSSSMDINDIGQILNNSQQVMQVRYYDFHSGEPYQLQGTPYLRGNVLSRYNDGRWERRYFLGEPVPMTHAPPADATGLVRQVIEIEPMNTGRRGELPVLFGGFPWATSAPNENVRVNESQMLLVRAHGTDGRRLHYELVGWGFEGGHPPREYPNYRLRRFGWQSRDFLTQRTLRTEEFARLIQMPEPPRGKELRYLKALATRLVGPLPLDVREEEPQPGLYSKVAPLHEAYERLPADEVRRRALRLESHLRDSGEFSYSLSARRTRNDLDPVEEFLEIRKEGHCEFFASALALMLRSQKIPARVVCGFAGGEWNGMGEFYQFRQYHAHAWVEAYLPGGRWIRLDATPPDARAEVVAQQETQFAVLRQMTDYLDNIWAGYVLGMDDTRQDEIVYKPIREFFFAIVNPQEWQVVVADAWAHLKAGNFAYFWNGLWSRQGGLMLAGLLLVVLLGTLLVRWLLARRRGQTARRVPPGQEFYFRLEKLLAQYNYVRPPHQTPREFAAAVGGALAGRLAAQQAAAVPQRIAEVFYRVRYGNRELDDFQRKRVEADLAELAAALSDRSPNGRKP